MQANRYDRAAEAPIMNTYDYIDGEFYQSKEVPFN